MDDEQVDVVSLRVAARAERKSVGRLSRLVRASLGLVWASGRPLFLALVALQLVAAAALAGQVLAVQSVLDAILTDAAVASVVGPVLALAGLTALSMITSGTQGQVQRLLGEKVARSMWHRVLGVATGVGLRHFESPEFYNRLNRVQTNAMTRPYQVTQGLLGMAGALAASLGVGIALVSVSPLLLPLVVVGGIPILITSRRESRLEFDFSVRQTVAFRWRQYFTILQTGRDEAKEVRAFGLGPWLLRRFDGYYQTYLDDLSTHVRRRTILTVIGQIGAAVVLVGTLLVLVWLISEGRIGVAGAGAAIVAIRMLATQVQNLFKGVQTIFESGLFLDDLNGFLELGNAAREEDHGAEAPSGFQLVEAEGLRFRYPGSDVEALRGVDIRLEAGEVVALVGENGSGKTTLAKLLAGLYEPDGGTIRWDGRDISEFRPSSLRKRITVVFQDFVRYALTATENIAVGRIDAPVDPERLREAARAAGASSALEGLPEGYDTLLSRLFSGGRELSGGQWQRVALARSFYRDAPLVILDEPSAALDPRAEYELFSTLRAALHGRTAMFISHRFSTVRGADRIYVLSDGEVVEEGSHDELIARDGRYAELFRLQFDAYVVGDGAAREVGD
ncbi:ABC transporter ATP-binding protein/permease [Tessaracoccus sp. OS52]|uniref:ABC transporter ATP-binding protein n=1 Tax=Tessaracoccus sp. OS52 TaxID=2886691 RepID=UPI001D10B57B|nr:ABC transporter ATP-binding protein [Tessaracoccus sp. OS52]MCC2593747.1 ABC transporter ATP-binding protein/permease [Tessaracoccus sp. OS52]